MTRRGAVAILAVVLVSGFLAGYSAWDMTTRDNAGAAESTQGKVCFPASKWDANDDERPCSEIVKVWEDGSTRVRVTQADGKVLWITGTGSRW